MFNFYTSVLNGNEFAFDEITDLRRKLALELNGKDALEAWEQTGKYNYR